jgi:hypothetical protein
VIAACRNAYQAYEFHKVYHTLNQFCAADLSSLYIDITKDRMYCDGPDSSRRRATQAAMHNIFDALCRLLRRFSLHRRGSVALLETGGSFIYKNFRNQARLINERSGSGSGAWRIGQAIEAHGRRS